MDGRACNVEPIREVSFHYYATIEATHRVVQGQLTDEDRRVLSEAYQYCRTMERIVRWFEAGWRDPNSGRKILEGFPPLDWELPWSKEVSAVQAVLERKEFAPLWTETGSHQNMVIILQRLGNTLGQLIAPKTGSVEEAEIELLRTFARARLTVQCDLLAECMGHWDEF